MNARRYVHGVGSNQHATKPGRNITPRHGITPDFDAPTYPDSDDSDIDTTGERAPFEPPTQPPVPMPAPDPTRPPVDTPAQPARVSAAVLAAYIGVRESDVRAARTLGVHDDDIERLRTVNAHRAAHGWPAVRPTALRQAIVDGCDLDELAEVMAAGIPVERWRLARSVGVTHAEIMAANDRFAGDPVKLTRYLSARVTKGPRRALLAAGDRRWWRL
jgi:hypothetical protein